jgi:hypothetical protein
MDLREIRLESLDWMHLAQLSDSCEPSDSIKGGKFDQLRNYQLLKSDFAPLSEVHI